MHDSNVFDWSKFKIDFVDKNKMGVRLLLADSAYKLTDKVLKPYSQTEIMGDPARKRFNKALCGARTEPKENIIGRLEAVSWKGKARREELKNQFFTNYNRAQRGQ
eukprot:TRINITY_DN3196_c0_g2_i6.p1 TRINITY_DN3196_c0_g2~~TRINITY_DN3196_c0_g2_i6.p1  ORF type:complete len:106 (-),score=24.42 TRINITY_DN3196_c0_g2_i6:20-337(-)